jgi:3-dehydroquinate dehydratase / shikimate dehydrogenase
MSAETASFVPRPLPLRLPRVCVPVAGASAAELVEKAEAMLRDNSFLEFRLDYLKSPGLALPHIRRFLGSHPQVVAIATCRRAVNGGKFRGSLAAEVDILGKAAANGCHLIDLELQSASAMKPADLQRLRSRTSLILSFHDFKATKKIEQTFARMQQFAADYYKIVTTATSLFDNVLMMKLLEQTRNTHSVIGVCMGEQGIISRVLGLRAGSLWTFAAASPGEETAPGMITAKVLRDVYRIEQVDTATKVYGVAGDPVSHSLSPQMMNAAFRRENVNAVYLALHAKTLNDLLNCVREIPIHGLSVTMPYKEAIVEELDNSDPLTQKTGACNTVVRAQDGKIYGFNTDVAGIVQPLEQRLVLAGAKVLVLGAGGAARAAVFGLKTRGAEVFILNRTPAPAQKLARQAKARVIKRSDLKKLAFDVIINATPVGMDEGKTSPLNEKELKAKFVMDMVYCDVETKFLRLARAQGASVIPGWEMFVYQGARQFEIWTGKPAPLAEMQNEVLSALAARARNGNNHKKR